MKKWLLISSILPLSLTISCSLNNNNDQDRNQNILTSKNVINITAKLGISDINASINNPNLKWNDFLTKFNSILFTDPSYETKLSNVINENWALFISNLDYFAYYKYPTTKWFMYKEKENAKYSDLYKHSIGLIKIDNESIPHSHIKQVDKIIGFKSFSDISDAFTSNITNNTRIYVSFGRVIMQIEKEGTKVKILPQFLYFINEPGAYSGAIDASRLEVVKEVLNVHPDNFTETLGAIIDRTTKEIGYPAYVYLAKK